MWMGTKLPYLQEFGRLGWQDQKQFQQPDKNAQTNTQQKFQIQTKNMRQAQAQNFQCTQDYKVP